MLRTLIVDDEEHCINRLLHLIERRPQTFDIIATSQSVDEALKVASKEKLDLVFLDIEINDKTGFEFLKTLEKVNFKVIFTTAFDNYAIKALKFNAFDYLMKPIDVDEFNETIERLTKSLKEPFPEDDIKGLLQNIDYEHPKILTIPSLNGFETITLEEIVHFEASTNYTFIHTLKDKKIVSKPLKFYEDLLNGSVHFFKCHKSHIINLNFVKSYRKGKHPFVELKNGAQVPIALRRKDSFLNRFT